MRILCAAAPGLLVASAATGGAAAYIGVLPDEYTGTAVVSLSPRHGELMGSDTLHMLAEKYVAYLLSPSTLRDAAQANGRNIHDLDKAINVMVAPGTVNISIVTSLRDPRSAAAVSNTLAAAAVNRAKSDEVLRPEVMAAATVPEDPSQPDRGLLVLLGSSCGLTLGVLVAIGLLRVIGPVGRRRHRRSPTRIAARRLLASGSGLPPGEDEPMPVMTVSDSSWVPAP